MDHSEQAAYENDLIVSEAGGADDNVLIAATASGFLPRLQLASASTNLAKEGKASVNAYTLVNGDSVVELGKEIEVVILAGRAKALDYSGESSLVSYEPKSSLYQEIAAGAKVPRSKKMAGPEFLIWVPSVEQYATLWLISSTAQQQATAIHARLHKGALFTSTTKRNRKGDVWQAMVCQPCTSPLSVPPKEDYDKQISDFKNAKSSEVEIVEDDGVER